MNVVFEAGLGVVAVEIDFAGRDLEEAVDEVNEPMREVAGEIRAEVSAAVFDETACNIDARVAFVGQFYIRIGFVIAK